MAPQAPSKLRLYQDKWKTFESWYESQEMDPFQASIPQIADFLLFLLHEKLSFKSIEGYSTVISRPIKLSTGLMLAKTHFCTTY